MIKNLIWNDIKQNKLLSAATVFFMTISAMLLALTVLLASGLLGAIDSLMDKARVPDFMQMHTGELKASEISRFAQSREEIKEWQICRFLNFDNSQLTLGGISLADSTQDNGLCTQGEGFDYLVDMENKVPGVLPGQIYVPVCYRTRYHLSMGDTMEIGDYRLFIAGFLRDAQMNSMMASSKRFLVHPKDYEGIKAYGNGRGIAQEEYLIEFLVKDGADMSVLGTAYAGEGLPANGPAVTRPLIRMMNALSDGTMIFVIFLLSIVILLISLLCIRFMLLLKMERDRKEVGMLKALGVGKKEIRRLYFAKYALFSGLGAAFGLLMASLQKEALEKQLKEAYGAGPGGLSSAALAVLAVLLVEGILLLSIRRALKKMEKLSALEALLAPQEERPSRGIFSSVGPGIRKNSRRQYFVIGLVALACTLLMLVPQNLYSTMSAPEFVTYMGIGDGEIRMDVRQTEEIDSATEQIALALKQDTQVRQYAVLRTKSCPVVLEDGTTINLTVETGNHNIFPVSCLEGRLPGKQGEIALSSMNGEELGLTVGDTLKLMVDGKPVVHTVCGIYSDITNGGKTAKAYDLYGGGPSVWSVVYVSLEESAGKEAWMEGYREKGVDVTDIADYVKDTYGQTLQQLGLASKVTATISVLVIFMVVMLFMRLIVEKNRYRVSLYKALGFTGLDIKRRYFLEGLLPVAGGIVLGLLLGNMLGESLCGVALKAFGADSFRFVIDWEQVLVLIPAVLSGAAIPAILAGIAEIGKIRAYECCVGRE